VVFTERKPQNQKTSECAHGPKKTKKGAPKKKPNFHCLKNHNHANSEEEAREVMQGKNKRVMWGHQTTQKSAEKERRDSGEQLG